MSSDTPPADAEREWHVLLSGERRGPYSQEALCEVLGTHPAGWRSPVWRPGMLDWRPAREVHALLQDVGSATHAQRGAVLFPDAGSDPVLNTQPLARGRVAPLSAETTRDLPVYKAPRPFWRRSMLAAALGASVAVAALLLLRLQLAPASRGARLPIERVAPALPPAAVAPPPPVARAEAAPVPVAQLQPAPAPAEPARSVLVTEDRPVRASRVKSVRVRARWAPVRAAGDPDAKVLCSLPRGALAAVSAERPGTHLRWFEVRCSGGIKGWLHENFVARVR